MTTGELIRKYGAGIATLVYYHTYRRLHCEAFAFAEWEECFWAKNFPQKLRLPVVIKLFNSARTFDELESVCRVTRAISSYWRRTLILKKALNEMRKLARTFDEWNQIYGWSHVDADFMQMAKLANEYDELRSVVNNAPRRRSFYVVRESALGEMLKKATTIGTCAYIYTLTKDSVLKKCAIEKMLSISAPWQKWGQDIYGVHTGELLQLALEQLRRYPLTVLNRLQILRDYASSREARDLMRQEILSLPKNFQDWVGLKSHLMRVDDPILQVEVFRGMLVSATTVEDLSTLLGFSSDIGKRARKKIVRDMCRQINVAA